MPLTFRLVLIILLISCQILGQDIQILDELSEEPIGFVTITQANSKAFAISDINGKAKLEAFDYTQNISFYIIGYARKEISWEELNTTNSLVYLTPQSIAIEPIVVSTSRWNQSNGKDPSKISRINSKDISTQNPQTAADMLGKSGEIFIQKSQQGGGSPMIRGFSANRLLYAVDGIRMNNAIFRSGNLQNVISIDPLSIERSDVIFGPGSVSYGSDAIGGVMSFITKLPDLRESIASGTGLIRYSSANQELTAHADVSYGNQKWSALTSITYNQYNDLRMGSRNGEEVYLLKSYAERANNEDIALLNDDPLIQKNTGFNQYSLLQKIRYQPNKNWDVQLGLHYATTTDYGRYDRLIRNTTGVPISAEWYYGPQEWLMANLQTFHTSNNPIFDKSITRVAYQKFGESRHDRDFGTNIRSNRYEDVDAISFNYDLLKRIASNSQLSYGIEGIYNKVNSSGNAINIVNNTTNIINPRYPNSDWYSMAAFANVSHKVSESLLIDGGFRYNYFDLSAKFDTTLFALPFDGVNLNNNGISGSLGLAYRPNDTWYFALNGSTGFRSPNVDDMGKIFDSEPGNVVVPNPDLSAENAYNIESSISKLISDKIKIDATGYYTLLKDGMIRRNFTFEGKDSILYDGQLSQVQSTINAANINIFGLQARIEIQLPYNIKIYSTINVQQGEEELDNGQKSPTRHAAPTYGLIRISKKINKLYVELNSQFSAGYEYSQLPFTEASRPYLYAMDLDGNPYSPSWYTINLTTNYKINQHFTVNLGVENILDRQYRPYSSGLVAPGINGIFSIKGTF